MTAADDKAAEAQREEIAQFRIHPDEMRVFSGRILSQEQAGILPSERVTMSIGGDGNAG